MFYFRLECATEHAGGANMGHFFVHARMQGQWFRWNDSRPVDQSLPGELGDCTLFLVDVLQHVFLLLLCFVVHGGWFSDKFLCGSALFALKCRGLAALPKRTNTTRVAITTYDEDDDLNQSR